MPQLLCHLQVSALSRWLMGAQACIQKGSKLPERWGDSYERAGRRGWRSKRLFPTSTPTMLCDRINLGAV